MPVEQTTPAVAGDSDPTPEETTAAPGETERAAAEGPSPPAPVASADVETPPEDPVETFKRHVWVAPFHEDDVLQLRDLLGAENLLMGSDWPHAEGMRQPTDYVHDLGGFPDDEIRLVMRENALALSKRRLA